MLWRHKVCVFEIGFTIWKKENQYVVVSISIMAVDMNKHAYQDHLQKWSEWSDFKK